MATEPLSSFYDHFKALYDWIKGNSTDIPKVQQSGSIVAENVNLTKVNTPIGFKWQKHPLVDKLYYNYISKEFIIEFDISDLKPLDKDSANVAYIAPDGDDSAGDGSKENPYQDIGYAIDQGNNYLILLDGLYTRQNRSGLTLSDQDLVIVAENKNKVDFAGGYEYQNWTKTDGYDYVYEADRSAVEQVIDLTKENEYGDYTVLTEESNIDDVENNEGSFYTDDVTVYIHLLNDREPVSNDTSFFLSLKDLNFQIDLSNSTVYIEGINILGGRACDIRNETGDSNLYIKDCKFKYGQQAGGLRIYGLNTVISQNCEAAKNLNDGFNYHEYNGYICNAVEIDCIGRENGNTSTDNGSTMHDGGSIIRFRGQHFDNVGPNVIDISEDTHSWNLGVKSSYSVHAGNVDTFAFGNEDSDYVTAWLDKCVAYGGDIRVATNSYLFNKKSILNGDVVDGTIYDY